MSNLAKHILEAATKHEASFDSEAAGRAVGFCQDNVDFKPFYKLTLRQACEQVCSPDTLTPTFLLLHHSWNDAIEWATAECKKASAEDQQISVSLNSMVTFTVSESGANLFALAAQEEVRGTKAPAREVSSETNLPLWDFMSFFGPHIGPGKDANLFENISIRAD